MRKGTFYCVGVGPGDPRLMTLLAVETIGNCPVIALPSSGGKENLAMKIAGKYLEGKELLFCDMPMIRDKQKLEEYHRTSAQQISLVLDQGKDVAFLTLGDPSIYSTPMYLHHILREEGYETSMVPGVPSFCAVAAALNTSLCEGGEALQVIPASYPQVEEALAAPGNKVLMKSGKSMEKIKEKIDTARYDVMAVECCGMEDEKIHRSLESLSQSASYFSVVVLKEKKES